MNKFSNVQTMIEAVPAVVDENIAKMESRPRFNYTYNEETKGFDSTEVGSWIKTPYGEVSDTDLPMIKDLMKIQAVKNIYQRYGRSKYVPHQSTREMNRRKARTNA